MDERGLSDIIAFVLTFSIIILSVSAVSVVGVDQLTDARDYEQIDSAERGMVALAATFEDISRHGARVRATELAMQDGSVVLADSTLWVDVRSNVSAGNWSSANGPQQIPVRSIQHRLDKPVGETTITYEAGGVFRSDAAGASYDPPIECAPEKGVAVVTVLRLTGSGAVGAGSPSFSVGPNDVPSDAPIRDAEQPVQIAGTLAGSQAQYISTDGAVGKTVYLNVSSTTHPEQWGQTLDRTGWELVEDSDVGWSVSGDDEGNIYRCQGADGQPLDTVVVREVTIAVDASL